MEGLGEIFGLGGEGKTTTLLVCECGHQRTGGTVCALPCRARRRRKNNVPLCPLTFGGLPEGLIRHPPSSYRRRPRPKILNPAASKHLR